MSTKQRLGIDIVGFDRTRAAFASVQRSMSGIAQTMTRVRSIVAGGFAAGFLSSMIRVNRQNYEVNQSLNQLSQAWYNFQLRAGDSGLNAAIISVSEAMRQLLSSGADLKALFGELPVLIERDTKDFMALYNAVNYVATAYDNFLAKAEAAMGFPRLELTVTADAVAQISNAADKTSLLVGTMRKGVFVFPEMAKAMNSCGTAAKAMGSQFDGAGQKAKDAFAEMKKAFDDAANKKAQEAFEKFKSTFADPMKASFADIITGSASVAKAVDNMFKQIQRNLAEQVSDKLFDYLFGFFRPGGRGPGEGFLFDSFMSQGGGGGGFGGALKSANQNMGGGYSNFVLNSFGIPVEQSERRTANGGRELVLTIDARVAKQIADPYSLSSPALAARGARSQVKRR